jgi:hypothetical protein
VKHFLITFLLFIPILLFSQRNSDTDSTTHISKRAVRRHKIAERKAHLNKLIAEEEEGALVYRKQSAYALKLNTDGMSFYYEHGKYKTMNRTNLWWLEFGEKKSQKQNKQTPQPTLTSYPGFSIISVGNNFVYGKVNNFYPFKIGFGRQYLLGNKGTTNGIAITAAYGGGVSLGVVKPYFLQVVDSTSATEISDLRYNSDHDKFLDPGSIVGASSISKGIPHITVIPGLHLRGSLRFDYGRFRESLSALEIGFNADYYASKITIMANNPSTNLFANAYLAIVFGRRK